MSDEMLPPDMYPTTPGKARAMEHVKWHQEHPDELHAQKKEEGMSENFEAERDMSLRATVLHRKLGDFIAEGTQEELYVPDKMWAEFIAFVHDLDIERRVRRWVRDEWAHIKTERQEECDHARSAKLVDSATGLLRCDDCGAEFRYSDQDSDSTPEQLEDQKKDTAEMIARLAKGKKTDD